MRKKIVPVTGMHCKACETLLEKCLGDVAGVSSVSASRKTASIEIGYGSAEPDWNAVESAVLECGYRIGEAGKAPWIQKDPSEWEWLIASSVGLFWLWFLFRNSWGGMGTIDASGPSHAMALLVGLTAGFSTCMALVGGIVLGISAKWNESRTHLSKWDRFAPHLAFNAGRILGFGMLGGLLGAVGGWLSIDGIVVGGLTVGVGILMFLLWLNLTNVFPRLANLSPSLPAFAKGGFGGKAGALPAAIAWVATFFLPCGFTLAMQAAAVASGSFPSGAATMALFAIGTAPGLLGIGGLASALKGRAMTRFVRTVGVATLAFAVFNVGNGMTLFSMGRMAASEPRSSAADSVKETGAGKERNVQEIWMTESDEGYSPNEIRLEPNARVRLVIDAKAPYGCAGTIVIPSVGVRKRLSKGENVIEFDAPASGEIPFSCSMGMFTGKFDVSER